jgi:hypothetical protein
MKRGVSTLGTVPTKTGTVGKLGEEIELKAVGT